MALGLDELQDYGEPLGIELNLEVKIGDISPKTTAENRSLMKIDPEPAVKFAPLEDTWCFFWGVWRSPNYSMYGEWPKNVRRQKQLFSWPAKITQNAKCVAQVSAGPDAGDQQLIRIKLKLITKNEKWIFRPIGGGEKTPPGRRPEKNNLCHPSNFFKSYVVF